jgi:AraC-like DNA-binding protein
MYRSQLPSFPLHHYVSCFWEGELVIDAHQVHTHYAIANSKTEWLFCFAGNYITTDLNGAPANIPRAAFYGQTSTYKQYTSTAAANGFFGVQLYAHALPLLFNIPATQLTNQQIDIASLLNSRGAELAGMIFQAGSFDERVKIATAFLESCLYRKSEKFARLEKLIISVYNSQKYPSITDLANQCNLSLRQFERHFKDLTGFPAKTFFNIIRFEKLMEALTCKEEGRSQTLTNIALDLGFYDQAHLNRQFKEFTGMSPNGYLKLQEVQDR